jgi:hypothetical protein
MPNFIKKAVVDRISGDKPSPFRAIGVAAVVGGAAAVLTYRALRR